MKFSEALQTAIDTGIGIYRPSWNGNQNRASGGEVAQFVEKRDPADAYPMTSPWFVIRQPSGCATWVPSVGDLFAEDWETL